MKQVFKIAPLALAVAAFSTTAIAYESNNHGRKHHKPQEGAQISKQVSVKKDVHYKGGALVLGLIKVDSLGMAVIDQEQEVDNVTSNHDRTDNSATISNSALRGASGNIATNVSAGSDNAQSNAAALAAADERFAFGSADAEVFVDQKSDDNVSMFTGTLNTASMSNNALRGASGNIGVNVAAGAANVQANSFAGAVASGSMGEATVSVSQSSTDNQTTFSPEDKYVTEWSFSHENINLGGKYWGNSTSGSYDTVGSTITNGTAVQTSDVYPEIWIGGGAHGQGQELVGHLDFDDDNPSGDVFEFDVDGNITPNASQGDLRFTEAGYQRLSGTSTGWTTTVTHMYQRHQNNASMGDNVLRGASGNIGVNITAGAGNLQNNSLALSRVNAPTAE